MRVKIKGIHKVKRKLADGSTKIHYYAWRGGPKMEALPHTEQFAIEYAEHKKSTSESKIKTIETLIEHFTGTNKHPNPDFNVLADSTQRDHLYAFGIIKKEWPQLPIKLTQQRGMKAEIRKWHRSFSDSPRKADKLLFSLSKVFSYALADEIIDKNPCTGIERLYTGSRRDSVWSSEQVAKFRNGAPNSIRFPFEVAIHTGQRLGDILDMKWEDYDGTHLYFEQNKTKKRVKVRVHTALKEILDRLDRSGQRVLLNTRNLPWTRDGFKTSWGKCCTKLGITGVTFHDLRGTFITERRREGSTAEQIASISGHSISEVTTVLEKYYLADDQQVSDAVILRMEKRLQ